MKKKNVGCFGIFIAVMGGLVFVASIVGTIGRRLEGGKDYSSENYDEYEYVELDTSAADSRIAEALNSAEYADAGEEDRRAMIAQTLDTLYNEGEILAPAQYSAGADMYTFEYADGVLGGFCFKDPYEEFNKQGGGSGEPIVSLVTGEEAAAVIYNCFGNGRNEAEYYNQLAEEWTATGFPTYVDHDVTVDDLKYMESTSVIVLAMHGGMYNGVPTLVTGETPNQVRDMYYREELQINKSIAKVTFENEELGCRYVVLPWLFNQYYTDGHFDGTVIFSEVCGFYGGYETTGERVNYFSDAFTSLSADAVIGFYNSVYYRYSQNMMKMTLEGIVFDEMTPHKALEAAKDEYGEDDGYEMPPDKYYGTPILTGDGQDAVLFGNAAKAPEPTEPPAATEPPQAAPSYGSAYAAYKALLESSVWADYTASGAEGMSREEYAKDCLGCYYLWDLDKNGTEELVISSGWAQANFCLTAFTYSDGNLYTLGSQYCGSGFAFGEPEQTGIVIKSYHGDSSVHYRLDVVERTLRITQQREYIGDEMDFVHHLTAGGNWMELEAHSLDDTSPLG